MGLIWKKLKSEKGASLILALLFMLICLMVGSSILMAAMANAGKVRSNQREQQAYMILSSALKLVADDLTSATYQAEFRYGKEERMVLNGVKVTTHTFTCLIEATGGDTPGKYDCSFKEIFKGSLNILFAQNMEERNTLPGSYTTENKFVHEPGTSLAAPPLTGSFTVKSSLDALKDFEVTIDWELEENYTLYLTAKITDVPAEYKDADDNSIYKNFEMMAELTPEEEPTIVINNSIEYDKYLEATENSEQLLSTPLQWKIGWITGSNEEMP